VQRGYNGPSFFPGLRDLQHPQHEESYMATNTTPCRPFSVDLEVDPPSGDTELDFSLDKFCNDDGSEGWMLHFELQEKAPDGTLKSVVNLNIDVNDEDRAKAQATARLGMDDNQRAQAAVTAQVGNAVRTGDATEDDVNQQGSLVIPVRAPGSPS
jgi:hypothetical protein